MTAADLPFAQARALPPRTIRGRSEHLRVKRSGNWPELRSDRGWREATCVIGRRWAAVHPERSASNLPLSAARHRHRVLRTD
jgi:hypothetical protein